MKETHKKKSVQQNLPAKLSSSILKMVHPEGESPEGCEVICGPDENGDWTCVHVCPGGGG